MAKKTSQVPVEKRKDTSPKIFQRDKINFEINIKDCCVNLGFIVNEYF